MALQTDVIRGAVKFDGVSDRLRFSSFEEFARRYPESLTIELPLGVAGVVVGNEQPSEEDRDRLWIRRDNSGNLIGLYVFSGGKWQPFYQSILAGATGIEWVVGDSNNIPDGFVLIEEGDVIIPEHVVNAIRAQFVPHSAAPGFAYFAIRFNGY